MDRPRPRCASIPAAKPHHVLLLGMLLSWPAGVFASEPQPWVLPNTQVHSLHSGISDLDYEIRVWLPPDYAENRETYPAMLMLDADYSFPLVVSLAEHLAQRGQAAYHIIVAIGYANAAGSPYWYRRNRTRDYTPTPVPEGGYGAEFQKYSGGAPAFLGFIGEQLLPFLHERFRIDPAERVLVGHSYGGLFAAYVIENQPDLFARYLLVSPSLWYDNQRMLDPSRVAGLASVKNEKQIFLGVGAYENQTGRRMVDDLAAYAALIRQTPNVRATVNVRVFEAETHASIFPVAVSAGLRFFLSAGGRRQSPD